MPHDFIIFATVTLAATATVLGWLICRGLLHRLTLVAAVGMLGIIIAAWFGARQAGHRERMRLEETLTGIAPTYAGEIERMGHAGLSFTTPDTDPAYLNIIAAQKRWLATNPRLASLYTYRLEAGKLRFVAACETDYNNNGTYDGTNEARVPIGEIYEVTGTALTAALTEKASFSDEPESDRWGTWVTFYYPLRDAQGRTEAMLGVDLNAKEWIHLVQLGRTSALQSFLIGAFLFLSLIVGLGLWILTLEHRAEKRESGHLREERSKLDALVLERTQHLQHQIELTRATEERFSQAFHLTPLPMAILNATTGAVSNANAPLLRLAQGFPENVAGRNSPVTTLLAANPALMLKLTAPGPLQGETCRIRKANGQESTLLVSRESFMIGRERHLLMVADDISDRLAAEDQLRQSQKMEAVGQLAAGIAHDFNNIMTVILGRISDQVADITLPSSCRESLTEVLTSGWRAAELTQQLLAFGRQQVLALQPINLEQTLQSQITMLARVIGDHCLIEMHGGPGLGAVMADPAAVHHIVMNLILNARDAMPNGGRILVQVRDMSSPNHEGRQDSRLKTGASYLCLSIRDEGCGMSEEVRTRIFEPFFTTKEFGRGSGLGLPMVYGLVAQLSGWIEVESSPGQGSEFRIFLPAASAPAPQPVSAPHAKRRPSAPSGQNRTVMIVEDNLPLQRMLCGMVRRFGFTVHSASSADEALVLWDKERLGERIDLLITDIVMPGSMSGLGLGQRLQSGHPKLKIVYSSGYSSEMLHPVEIQPGERNYLPKPYDLNKLAALLEDLFPVEAQPKPERRARLEELVLSPR